MGKQELGETVTQCAVRETAEETGITVEVTGLLGIYSDPGHVVYYDSDGETRQEYEVILLGLPVSGQPTATTRRQRQGGSPSRNWTGWTSTRRSGGSCATGSAGRIRTSTEPLRSLSQGTFSNK